MVVIMLTALAATSAGLAIAGLVTALVSGVRNDSEEPAACEHAKPGYHCNEASCSNNENICVRCNTPEEAPWYAELDCNPV